MEKEIVIDGHEMTVYDTDPIPIKDLIKKDINWAYSWNDYYIFTCKTYDIYDAQIYIVNKHARKVEWGYYTSLGIDAISYGTPITSEELKRALA